MVTCTAYDPFLPAGDDNICNANVISVDGVQINLWDAGTPSNTRDNSAFNFIAIGPEEEEVEPEVELDDDDFDDDDDDDVVL